MADKDVGKVKSLQQALTIHIITNKKNDFDSTIKKGAFKTGYLRRGNEATDFRWRVTQGYEHGRENNKSMFRNFRNFSYQR